MLPYDQIQISPAHDHGLDIAAHAHTRLAQDTQPFSLAGQPIKQTWHPSHAGLETAPKLYVMSPAQPTQTWVGRVDSPISVRERSTTCHTRAEHGGTCGRIALTLSTSKARSVRNDDAEGHTNRLGLGTG